MPLLPVPAAHTRAQAGLHLHHCRTGHTFLIHRGRGGVGTAFAWNRPYADVQWSSDSEWLAFSAAAANSMRQVRGASTPNATPPTFVRILPARTHTTHYRPPPCRLTRPCVTALR